MLAAIAAGLLTACRFEPGIEPLVIPTLPPQPFEELAPALAAQEESPEEGIVRLLDELFDPFNLGGDLVYEGSVYELADQAIAGAYAYYGYDLAYLAAAAQNNPLTEQMILAYLRTTGLEYVDDPVTGEKFSVFVWFQSRLRTSGTGGYANVIRQFPGLDPTNPVNYERNYLAALMEAYPHEVMRARQKFRSDLLYFVGDDPVATYEYLQRLDGFGTE